METLRRYEAAQKKENRIPKHETNSNVEIPIILFGTVWDFVFRICLGFSASDFDFLLSLIGG